MGAVAVAKPYSYASSNPAGFIDPLGLLEYHSSIVKNPWSKECGLMTPWVSVDIECELVGGCWKPKFSVEAKYTVSFDDQDSYNHELKHVAVMNTYVFSQALAKLAPAEKKSFKKFTDCYAAASGARNAFYAAVNTLPFGEWWKHIKIDLADPCVSLW